MNKKFTSLEEIRSWAKQNGFIYPSSEIYGGFQAIYDYGHYGYLLKENIKNEWVKAMTQLRDDVVMLDSAIFMHPRTWEASGHVSGFDDVLVEDKVTHKRYRADHLIEDWFARKGEQVDMDKVPAEELDKIIKDNGITSPDGNELATPRSFNLLVKSNLGTTDSQFNDENVSYLRGETCQGIYLNYKNILDTMRVKLPFGIAQVGKAFRNEIVARQYVFRTREFEQMELQYFIKPEMNDEVYNQWKNERMSWYTDVLGIPKSELKFRPHEKLIFYAKAAEDIVYNFKSMGKFDEVEGIHARSDYDLSQHQKFSGQKLSYHDQESGKRFTPWIVEASSGLNRLVMMVIDSAFVREKIDDTGNDQKDYRNVLKLKPNLAPIKAAILPLSKKPELQSLARDIKAQLQNNYMVQYDETGSIGKRYRRQDEIGTPVCITVDFDSLEDGKVTVRERDTMEQTRVSIDALAQYVS